MKGKRLISVLLSLVLVLNIAFAIEGKADAASENSELSFKECEVKTDILEAEKIVNHNLKNSRSGNEYGFPEFTAKTVINSSTKTPSYKYGYGLEPDSIGVLAMKAEHTGWLWLEFTVNSESTDTNVQFYLLDEANFEKIWNGDSEYIAYDVGSCPLGESAKAIGAVHVKAGSTYYILACNEMDSGYSVDVGVRGKVFTTGSRNLSQGTSKWTIASGMGTESDDNGNYYISTTWFKVKPDRTGVMTVSLKEYGESTNGTVRLYNSSKGTALSNSVEGSKAYFGVKKGTTYYLKVTNCCGSFDYNYRFGIKYGMTSRTDRDLNSKSEAKKLTRKADATNTLFKASTSTSSSATTDWYKIYVSSKRKTRITVNASGMSSGEMKVTLYKGSTKIGSDTIKAGYKGTFKITTNYSDYATKGTYYVKIVKSKMCSGKYSIRYDQ